MKTYFSKKNKTGTRKPHPRSIFREKPLLDNHAVHIDDLAGVVGGIGDHLDGGVLFAAAVLGLEGKLKVGGLAGSDFHSGDSIGNVLHAGLDLADNQRTFTGVGNLDGFGDCSVLRNRIEMEDRFVVADLRGFFK